MTPLDAAGRKKMLLEIFGNWCPEVVTIIQETAESTILRRAIYDRDMIYTWGTGRVTLLGDAAHPMQPNLGQGGCMAIEVRYCLRKLNLILSMLHVRKMETNKDLLELPRVHCSGDLCAGLLPTYT